MEIHAFKTDDVEKKLNDIMSAFCVLSFALNGLRDLNTIHNDEIMAFDYIIRDARMKAISLADGFKPILTSCDERIVLLFGTQEEDMDS